MKIAPILLLLQLLLAVSASAQQPVARITQVAHSQNWYLEQAALWQQHLKEQPKDADAWLQYYFAARYANTTGASAAFDLNAIVDQATAQVPATASAEFLQYMKLLGSMEAFPHLLKAYEYRPEWTDLYHDMVGYYVLVGDDYTAKAFCRKWFDSGDYSPGLLKWNYNMLMSVEQNGILLTWGDNDTYPVWLLQYAGAFERM
ncbi:MAG: hypothetical protein IPL65_15825 [Lewinellaceae bacterium]|nr:hypothetical protein [Lewinellaceae bacterium]